MKRFLAVVVSFFVSPGLLLTQTEKSPDDQRIRVFITDSRSWEMVGPSGGARPQTAEIIKTFRERCPILTVTLQKEKADYIVLLDHEGGKKFYRRDSKVAVFNGRGDAIFSKSTRKLGSVVHEACEAISQDRSRGL